MYNFKMIVDINKIYEWSIKQNKNKKKNLFKKKSFFLTKIF